MKRTFLLVAALLLAFSLTSEAGVFIEGGGGGGGGSGATEHTGTVTRPTNAGDSFVVGTHGSPEITLDPTAKAISIAAGTAGQCNTLKESSSGANKLDSCVVDTLDADYTCDFDNGAYVGKGCPASRLFWIREPAAAISDPTVSPSVGPAWSSSTLYPTTGASTEVVLYPGYPDSLKFTRTGVYELVEHVRAAIKSATASDCTPLIPDESSADVTLLRSWGFYKWTNGTTTNPTTLNAEEGEFGALLQVTGTTDPYFEFHQSACSGPGTPVGLRIFTERRTGYGGHKTTISIRRID